MNPRRISSPKFRAAAGTGRSSSALPPKPSNLLENAAAKLRAKRLDLLVANDVSQNGAGFDVDTNIVTLLFPDGRKMALEKMSKLDVANRVLDEVWMRNPRQVEVADPRVSDHGSDVASSYGARCANRGTCAIFQAMRCAFTFPGLREWQVSSG